MKLNDFLKKSKSIVLEFASVSWRPTREPNQNVLTFILKDPIPIVIGKGRNLVTSDNTTVANQAHDVTLIQMHSSDIQVDEDAFKVNEDGSGTINTDKLLLDVALRDQSVWLTSKPLSSYQTERRRQETDQKANSILTKLQERAKSAEGSKDEPVVTSRPVGEEYQD